MLKPTTILFAAFFVLAQFTFSMDSALADPAKPVIHKPAPTSGTEEPDLPTV